MTISVWKDLNYVRNSTSVRVMRPGSTRSISSAAGRQLAVGVLLIRADGHHGQSRALPEILMLDLGHRHVELLQPVLDAPEHHALVFQRSRSGHVEFDGKQRNDHLFPLAAGPTPPRLTLMPAAPASQAVARCSRSDRDALHREHFDDVADLDVVELLEADAALEARP